MTKYPRTHPNPKIITRSNLYFSPYSTNLLDKSFSLSLSRCFPRINRGPVFRERCSRGEVLFSWAARATCGFLSPLFPGPRFSIFGRVGDCEEGRGGGEKDRIVSKGIDEGRGARKAVSIPSPAARGETGLDGFHVKVIAVGSFVSLTTQVSVQVQDRVEKYRSFLFSSRENCFFFFFFA